MPTLAVLFAVLAAWMASGLAFWLAVVHFGVRFEVCGRRLPNPRPLTLPERDGVLRRLREDIVARTAHAN